jgi:hypothetical protein
MFKKNKKIIFIIIQYVTKKEVILADTRTEDNDATSFFA